MITSFDIKKINEFITGIFDKFQPIICGNYSVNLEINWLENIESYYAELLNKIVVNPYILILEYNNIYELYARYVFIILHELNHVITYTNSYLYENSNHYNDYLERCIDNNAYKYYNRYYYDINKYTKNIFGDSIENLPRYDFADEYYYAKEYNISNKISFINYIINILIELSYKTIYITIDLYNMLYNNNGIILIDIENEKEISILNEYGININDFYNILFQVLNKYELNKYKRFVEIKCSYLDDGRQCFIYKIRFEKSNIDMVKLINGGNKND